MSINWTSNRTEQLTSLDGLQDTAKLGYNRRRSTLIGPMANGETLFGLINRTFVWKAGNAVKEYLGRKESVMMKEV
jgi:hypothetical protein